MKERHNSVVVTDHKAGQARSISHEMTTLSQTLNIRKDLLGREANELSMLLEIITEISEQIHLVAINAVLEANRAGETGKRFGVMVGEIKQLTSQTTLVTREIKDAIRSVCDSAEKSADDIDRITGVIEQLNEVVQNRTTTAVKQKE